MKKIVSSILCIALLMGCQPKQCPVAQPMNQEDTTHFDNVKQALLEFSTDSFSQLLSKKENLNYAPVSAYFALSLASMAAENDTEEELMDVMKFKGEKTALARQMKELYQQLYQKDSLEPANALWYQKNLPLDSKFTNTAQQDFFTELFPENFDSHTQWQLQNWVKEKTKGTLTPNISLSNDDQLVILNTLYVKDSWQNQFHSADTKYEPFYISKEKSIEAAFMEQTLSDLPYIETETYEAIDLITDTGNHMYMMKPKDNSTLSAITKDKDWLKGLLQHEAQPKAMQLTIPKFKIRTTFSIKDLLRSMGMKHAFSSTEADFHFTSAKDEKIAISAIDQGTYLNFNEFGIEASAYTAMKTTGISESVQTKQEFKLDQPFIYVLVSKDAVPLFIGLLQDPSQI